MEGELSQADKRKDVFRLIIVLFVLFIVLGGMILYLSLPLLLGRETIVLATQPIDPFDPLRGQYIIIRYEINTISLPSGAQEGDTIYVSLAEDAQGISRYGGVSLTVPHEDLFIKGEIKNIYGEEARVEYGIEQYFFERHAEFETQDIQVEAKVGSDGQARITRLLRQGEPIEIKYQKKSFYS